jgi:tetratricopeptide (TPR) repeat protein
MRVRAALAGLAFAILPGRASGQCFEDRGAAAGLVRQGDQVGQVNVDEALSKYQQAADLHPDDSRIWSKIALAEEKKEDWALMASACANAEAAAERKGHARTHAEYYFRHGHALEQLAEKGQGRWQDARAPLEMAVQLDPNYGQAYGELGYVLFHMDDEVGALRYWTAAIQKAPQDLQYYVLLADLYQRLLLFAQAEQVLVEGLSFASEGSRHLFELHGLLGSIHESRGDFPGAVTEYEAAKRACEPDHCLDHREASFNLGSAYAELTPPRKAEAIQQLQAFSKTTCKGALAARYADQCAQTYDIVRRLGAVLP